MEDILLTEFFKKERWEAAIETAVEKTYPNSSCER